MENKKNKQILIIGLTDKMGGVETFIYNTTRFSDKEKYEYDFLVHGTEKCVYQDEITNFYDNTMHFYFIRSIKKNFLGWFKDIITFYRSNGKKYDYIHLQTGATSEIVYVFPFCLIYKIKVISHSHNGYGYSPFINLCFQPVLNFVTCKWIACSKIAAKWLFGKKAKCAKILNNGIDTNRFKFDKEKRKLIRKQYNLNDEFVIGHVGRFSEQKNHEKILEVFVEIKKKISDAKLILVGTGERENIIKKAVTDLQMQDSVVFVGKQEFTENYYCSFDVFLMPSLYEGLPVVGIEAQCEGLPCFFSDKIDKKILITDRAKMIPLNYSSKKWAEIICNIQGLRTEREKYADIVSQKGYSIKSTIKKLEEIYEV